MVFQFENQTAYHMILGTNIKKCPKTLKIGPTQVEMNKIQISYVLLLLFCNFSYKILQFVSVDMNKYILLHKSDSES
jgi:hypothetical protein